MSVSCWSHLKLAPIEPTFGMSDKAKSDPRPEVVNLCIGIYCDDDGAPYVMPVVRKADQVVLEKQMDKEYAGMAGSSKFCRAALEVALGRDSPVIANNTYAIVQTVAGTGALRVAADFLSKHYPHSKTVYLSNHTWPNHAPIFREAGIASEKYRYYHPDMEGIDSAGLYEDLQKIPEKSIVLLQAAGHNPTGLDPTLDEWKKISQICKERSHFLVIDLVYQGFASGNLEEDAAGLRQLVADGNQMAIAQTFSKIMGLYGERVGTLTILCSTPGEAEVVLSHVKLVVRRLYSNPPIHGARIATEILTDPQLRQQWISELEAEAQHIGRKRQSLYDALVKTGSKVDWSQIIRQKGWFCFTGLTTEQIERLDKDYAVFVQQDGHVPIVALRAKEIDYIAKAFHEVTKN